MLKSFLRRPGVQSWLAQLMGRYLMFALRRKRWTIVGEEHLAPHFAGQPAVVAFWHECLPLIPRLWLEARSRFPAGVAPRAFVLVSRNKDGRIIGETIRAFGLDVLHGSTTRAGQDKGGAASVRQMLDALANGDFVAITPDGPRGPRHVAAPGVAQVAALAGIRVLPCAGHATGTKVLPTWDGLIAPLPWGRGVLVAEPTIAVPREGWEEAVPEIQAALIRAAERAAALLKAG
jgi:lysophospholipid acyltransferase (LPLAT)-like uncharacterized protein